MSFFWEGSDANSRKPTFIALITKIRFWGILARKRILNLGGFFC